VYGSPFGGGTAAALPARKGLRNFKRKREKKGRGKKDMREKKNRNSIDSRRGGKGSKTTWKRGKIQSPLERGGDEDGVRTPFTFTLGGGKKRLVLLGGKGRRPALGGGKKGEGESKRHQARRRPFICVPKGPHRLVLHRRGRGNKRSHPGKREKKTGSANEKGNCFCFSIKEKKKRGLVYLNLRQEKKEKRVPSCMRGGGGGQETSQRV